METPKIQLEITENRITIGDKMPIDVKNIALFLAFIFAFAIFFFQWIGIIYALVFSTGYVLFRYFANMLWKKIVIDIQHKQLSIIHMIFNNEKRTDIVTNNFELSKLSLKEFEQSGMKRAIIQYQNHKVIDLLLLTHEVDINLVKEADFINPHNQ